MVQGRFVESQRAFHRGHELGSRQKGWKAPSAQYLRNAVLLVDLDARLSAVLAGAPPPTRARDRLALARHAQRGRRLFAAAATLYLAAFSADRGLVSGIPGEHRINAACAAARAGCGSGEDGSWLGTAERLRWRRQALTWLRADLRAWQQLLDRDPAKGRAAVAGAMAHWRADADFNGVRGPGALARLPAEERDAWARLWADVDSLHAQTQEPKPRDKEKPDKP
jgi:hypothetical protein